MFESIQRFIDNEIRNTWNLTNLVEWRSRNSDPYEGPGLKYTELYDAIVRVGSKRKVRQLVQYWEDVIDSYAIAAQYNNLNIIQYLDFCTGLKSDVINIALCIAAKYGNFNIVKYIIDNCTYEANRFWLDDPEEEYDTPYCDINCYDSEPINIASKNGHLHVVQYLIKKKADIMYETLKMAVKYNHYDILMCLLIEIDKQNLYIEKYYKLLEIAVKNDNLNIILLLLMHVKNSAKYQYWITETLEYAIEYNIHDLVLYLLSSFKDINIKYGLFIAIENHHYDVFDMLSDYDITAVVLARHEDNTTLLNKKHIDWKTKLKIKKCFDDYIKLSSKYIEKSISKTSIMDLYDYKLIEHITTMATI